MKYRNTRMGQVQLLLEICNLEEAHFVQFKPGNLIYDEEFQVTKVFRDRRWFENNVKYMVDFVDTLQYVKDNTEIRNMFKRRRPDTIPAYIFQVHLKN